MFVAREQAIVGNRILEEESKMAQSQRRDERG